MRQTTQAPQGKLGILMPGMGAVATTLIAGVELIRKGKSAPIGSLTQLGYLPGEDGRPNAERIRDVVPLAGLNDLVFGGWDIYTRNCFETATQAKVIEKDVLEPAQELLQSITPMPAVFRSRYVKNLEPEQVKTGTWWELSEQLKDDIRKFKKDNDCDRLVMVWCGSTEVHLEVAECHKDLRAFENAMKKDDPAISPSMVYTYAALSMGVPVANGAPNTNHEVPALQQLAHELRVADLRQRF